MVLVLFLLFLSIMYVFRSSNVWIPEYPPILERAADSVCHLSHLFTDVTICCDFAEFAICFVLVPKQSPLKLSKMLDTKNSLLKTNRHSQIT